MAAPVVVTIEEMQEILLMREEITRREEALVVREEKARTSEKAVTQVSTH
jgi:hypothetical protein